MSFGSRGNDEFRRGDSLGERGEMERAAGGFSSRIEEDVEALAQGGGGSLGRHARHASTRRQRLKTPLPLAGWAGFCGDWARWAER